MTHTCTLASLFHSLFSEWQGSILASLLKQDARQTCATKQAYSRLRNTQRVEQASKCAGVRHMRGPALHFLPQIWGNWSVRKALWGF